MPVPAFAHSGRQLLGVRFDVLTLSEVRAHVKEALVRSAGQIKIFTPNPEMLVKAYRDAHFKDVLNRADIALCDGRGTEIALRYTYPNDHIVRITGADFTLEIASMCAQAGKRLFLLGGGGSEIAQNAAHKLTALFPNLIIAGTDTGPLLVEDDTGHLIEPENGRECINKIQAAAPDTLLVAFGMGKQEKWIEAHLAELPSVKIAMGVGGTFEFLAGTIPRAPVLIRRVGLEWLFRLFQEPRRIGRIWRATAVFSWLVAREIFKKTEP